jgi:two-component system nitrate/nitrite sensor histidine kinase NarX
MDLKNALDNTVVGVSWLEREHLVAMSLRETLKVLNSNQSLEDILKFIVQQAHELLSAQAVAIYRPTGQEGLLQIQAQEGLNEEYVREAHIPLGLLATGYATLTRHPVSIVDVKKALEQSDLPQDEERKKILVRLSQHCQSLLVVPMIFPKGEIYGTLDLYFDEPREFSEEDISIVQAFSDQAVLAIENARLRKRAEQNAINAERERLARDLHDTVTQTLFSASLIADVLPVLWEQDQSTGRMALEELRQLSRGALAEMRSLLFELRPAALLSADVNNLVQQQVDAFTSRTRIPVEYHTSKFECPMPPDAKIALYRITQELLNNIEKHAQATQVSLIFELVKPPNPVRRSMMHCRVCQKCVRIVVEDNGCGFEPGHITSDHMGLRIIRERVEGINAEMEIKSAPGQGTRVEIVW